MKKSIIKCAMVTAIVLFASCVMAQSNQTQGIIDPPKGDGSHQKDTSYSITSASKSEVRGASGQGNVGDNDTVPPRKHKRKFGFTSPSPGNTNAGNGSNIAPGR